VLHPIATTQSGTSESDWHYYRKLASHFEENLGRSEIFASHAFPHFPVSVEQRATVTRPIAAARLAFEPFDKALAVALRSDGADQLPVKFRNRERQSAAHI
jgi:hypothetical protein